MRFWYLLYIELIFTRVIKIEIFFADLIDNVRDQIREWELDLGSFFHILELADFFLRFHDADNRDIARTDAIRLFQLSLHTWCSKSEERVNSAIPSFDTEWKREFFCLVAETDQKELNRIFIFYLYPPIDHRLDHALRTECESDRRDRLLVSDRLRELIVATSTSEGILCPSRPIDELPDCVTVVVESSYKRRIFLVGNLQQIEIFFHPCVELE